MKKERVVFHGGGEISSAAPVPGCRLALLYFEGQLLRRGKVYNAKAALARAHVISIYFFILIQGAFRRRSHHLQT